MDGQQNVGPLRWTPKTGQLDKVGFPRCGGQFRRSSDEQEATDAGSVSQGEGGPGGVRGDKTTAQLASEFDVHTSQVTAWKKQLLEGVSELFEDGRQKRSDEPSADEQELYEQIGRLKMEVEWLKKKSQVLG